MNKPETPFTTRRFGPHPKHSLILDAVFAHLNCAVLRGEVREITVTVRADDTLWIHTPSQISGITLERFTTTPREQSHNSQRLLRAIDNLYIQDDWMSRRSPFGRGLGGVRFRAAMPNPFKFSRSQVTHARIEGVIDNYWWRILVVGPNETPERDIVQKVRALRPDETPRYAVVLRTSKTAQLHPRQLLGTCAKFADQHPGVQITFRDWRNHVFHETTFMRRHLPNTEDMLKPLTSPFRRLFIPMTTVAGNLGSVLQNDELHAINVSLSFAYQDRGFTAAQGLFMCDGRPQYRDAGNCDHADLTWVHAAQEAISRAFHHVLKQFCNEDPALPLPTRYPKPFCVLNVESLAPPTNMDVLGSWVMAGVEVLACNALIELLYHGGYTCTALKSYFTLPPRNPFGRRDP